MSWNVFDALPDGPIHGPTQARRQEHAHRALHLALGHPAGRQWLADSLAAMNRQLSYMPGRSPDHVAYIEGRRSILLEMQQQLDAPPIPEE